MRRLSNWLGITALALLVVSAGAFSWSGGGNSAAEVASPTRDLSGWTCILGMLLLLIAGAVGFAEWLRNRRP